MPAKINNLLLNTSLVIVSAIVTLLIAELVIRLYITNVYFQPETSEIHASFEVLPDDPRVYGLRRSNPVLKTNSMGFRSPEFPSQKTEGDVHLIMLGDSIMVGSYTIQETVPAYLEKILHVTNPDIRVFNLGVTGYNTSQELATLESIGLKLEPDIIVLNLCLNDSDPIMRVWEAGLRRKAEIRNFQDINLRTIIGSSYLLTYVKSNVVSLLQSFNEDLLEDLHNPAVLIDSRVSESAWSDMKADISEIKNVADMHNARFFIAIYPYASQIEVDKDHLKPQKDLSAFFIEQNIEFLDLIDVYAAADEEMFNDGTLHLTSSGSQRVAAAIADKLEKLGYVEPQGQTSESHTERASQYQSEQ